MTTFLFLCFGFISSYLISLDVLLRYPVTPDVSSRSRRALQYVFGIHFMYPFYFFIHFFTSIVDENDSIP